MSLFGKLFGGGGGRPPEELARRLGMPLDQITALKPAYQEFAAPKRSGGTRAILAPSAELKALQRAMLRRVLGRLKVHPAVHGFERKRSIVTNARPHVGSDVVIRMDIKDFFGSTTAKRVEQYFRKIGWSAAATGLITRLCTWKGALPQGAPTSPRLSNIVNYKLDVRLAAAAARYGMTYTRYADDLTFSFSTGGPQPRAQVTVRSPRTGETMKKEVDAGFCSEIVWMVKDILEDEGYELHMRKKLHIRRRHHQQLVTGLVVNDSLNLPRSVRRRLRAVTHHLATGRPATLNEVQLQGWRAFADMVEKGRQ